MNSRREFLKAMGLVGGGLILELSLSGCTTPLPHGNARDFEPDAWLQITPQNDIRFYLNSVEMGQGTMTGMATLIAEELNTEPYMIEVKSAGVHADYVNPFYGVQVTGGSTSTRIYYDVLRRSAAQAREMLRAAAAAELGVDVALLEVRDKHIIYRDTRLPMGRFVQAAQSLSRPEVSLKSERDFRFIGRPSVRLDGAMKVRGTAQYGIDVQLPDLFTALVKRCPVQGGHIESWSPNGADELPGVKAIVPIANGVAVVAETYWHAQRALQAITVSWAMPALSQRSSEDIRREFEALAASESGRSALSVGDARADIRAAALQHAATYRLPYLAHATMEPMNCTVRLRDDHCEIWVPTQVPSVCAAIAEEVTGLRRHQITVHTTLLGGGFGRRLSVDYALEATQIAKATGLTIKLVFSREDDMQHDYYRPAAHAEIKAGLDEQGRITGWHQKNVNPNILPYAFQEFATAVLPAWLPDGLVRGLANLGPWVYGTLLMDPASTEGAVEFGYDSVSAEVRHVQADPGLRTGYWRSVGHSINAFVVESFMDELAHRAGRDPLQFRLQHLAGNPRLAAVLRQVAEVGRWGAPMEPGSAQGIAAHYSFGSYVAQLVEVSVVEGDIRVHRVTVAIDCGKTINPDIIKAQMEGGVIFGLTAALRGEITLQDGRVQQTNFHDYPLLRMHEAPAITVHIVSSAEAPGGVGEPAVPPIAPALANALFAATGQRLRDLPLRLS